MPHPPALRPVEFDILLTLFPRAHHGYAIMVETARRSGRKPMGTATLYRAIKRLVDGHLIEPADPRSDADSSDERRQYYAITPDGRAVLKAESERLAALVAQARQLRVLRESTR